MTGDTTLLFHLQHDDIGIAVQTNFAHALHMAAAKRVCAAGQAAAYRRIEPLLSEEEQAAFRRGRNAHSGTVPKNAQLSDYRIATGGEALVGFLYWTGQDARLSELMQTALECGDSGEKA